MTPKRKMDLSPYGETYTREPSNLLLALAALYESLRASDPHNEDPLWQALDTLVDRSRYTIDQVTHVAYEMDQIGLESLMN